ncbi:MAG: squalene--hopene cyclase [Verrucomicrobiales bacterium]|nr:squalene--hopene cyclase [Verrucomicrobiales bacterium]
MTPDLQSRAQRQLARLNHDLIAELDQAAHWTGHLSASALSTAVATIALGEVDRRNARSDHQALVERGLGWLAKNANPDGGWGDTPISRSNLSTTALVWAAFGAAQADPLYRSTLEATESWIHNAVGSRERLVPAIEARYGKDRTFSVPIVLTLALSGRLGPDGWRHVPALPFELASLPRSWFGALRMPVVSYALPALIALGQAIHHHAPSPNPFAAIARRLTATRTRRTLETLQPANGGFLEATPLTAFVTMSLASMGLANHPVAVRGAGFLTASVREDGSWPIDTNLATWVTTLSVKALHHAPAVPSPAQRQALRDWLLGQQYHHEHPYTGAPPGGWAWTDLPGGVPDADDTAGALLALDLLQDSSSADRCLAAATSGLQWLLNLQNRDGGIPTFCRGWGTLPFDRSSPDLTAHALRAWATWRPRVSTALQQRLSTASSRATRFLERTQSSEGSWTPLWFGNESAAEDGNPVYGTAQVLLGLPQNSSAQPYTPPPTTLRAVEFLLHAQHTSGGWGGAPQVAPSIEETGLTLSALQRWSHLELPRLAAALHAGTRWLVEALEAQNPPAPAPIGLYFAKLWYHERLYPVVAAVDALAQLTRQRPGG